MDNNNPDNPSVTATGRPKRNVESKYMRVIDSVTDLMAERAANRTRYYTELKVGKKNHSWDNPTLTQAMQRDDWPKWKEAIDKELQQLMSEGVYKDEDWRGYKLPKGSSVVGSMFVLQIKRNKTTGEIESYKARLVALGNQQGEQSYDKIASGTARNASVKMLIALQAKTGAESMVLDIKGAYLKASVTSAEQGLLFLKLPNGNIVELQKYLYGLKQSGRMWQETICATLRKLGYSQTIDPLVYVKHIGKDFIMLCLHVDDFYCISNKRLLLDKLYNELVSEYKEVTKKVGDTIEYLGLSINYNRTTGHINVTQPAYVDKIISAAHLDEAAGVSTPFASTQTHPKHGNEEQRVDRTYYLKLVGLINYLAINTRPDLLYAMSIIAQASSNPTEADLVRVKRVIRYIKSTKHYGLTFIKDEDFNLYCYVDASYNSYSDGKSHCGYTFSIGRNNGSFYAKSAKIRIVTLSSTEAEYVALCYAATEVVYLRKLLCDLGFLQSEPTILFEDNASCIKMVYTDIPNHKTTKHINNKFHYTRELIKEGSITVKYVSTTEQIADLLTKPLSQLQTAKLSQRMLSGK